MRKKIRKALRILLAFLSAFMLAVPISAADSVITTGGRVTPYIGGAYFITSSNNTVRGISSFPSRFGTDENGMRFLFFGKLYDVIQPGVYKIEIDLEDEYWGNISEGIVDWQQNAGFGLYLADPYLWNDLPTALFQYGTCPETFMSFTADGRALQARPGCYLKSYVSHGVGSDGKLHYTLLFTITAETISYPESLYKYLCFGFDDYSNLSVQISAWEELPLSSLDVKSSFDDIVSAIDRLSASMGGMLTQDEVQEAITRALDERDRRDRQEAEAGVDGLSSEIQSHLLPYTQTFQGMTSALASIRDTIASPSGTAIITLPAGEVLSYHLWDAQSFDLIAWYDTLIPAPLRTAIPIVAGFSAVLALVTAVAQALARLLSLGGDEKHD